MKKFFILVTFILLNSIVFAEDWIPSIYDGEKLEKAGNIVKNYIEKNGTYLSGTKEFSFYYIKGVNFAYDSIDTKDDTNSVFSIIYKDQVYYLNDRVINKIDYSVITDNAPVIYLKYVSFDTLNSVIIRYNGTDFLMYTTECATLFYDEENPGEFTKRISIPYRFSYLQGNRTLTVDQIGNSTYVYSKDSYRFWLIGIDGVTDINDVYFQTYITDDKLRLRTSNSKNSNVIKLLDKGTLVRILNIDSVMNQMEGKDGFWVLIETYDNYVGWIWSNYLKGFSFDITNHYTYEPSHKKEW